MLATAADLAKRYDLEAIKDLASDTGTPVADITKDPNVLAALRGSSGRLQSAVFNAGNYDKDDLKLYDEDDGRGLQLDDFEYLKDIVCDLAMLRLLKRRPEKFGDDMLKSLRESTEETLELIRSGKNIFNLPLPISAGLPTVDGPTAVTYSRLNMIPDRTKNFYPNRSSRLPIGR